MSHYLYAQYCEIKPNRMNAQIHRLYEISEKKERTIIGLMSGTSLDGLDIAMCRIQGSGMETKVNLIDYACYGYNAGQKALLREVCFNDTVKLPRLSKLNRLLAEWHATYVLDFLHTRDIAPVEIDIIASHGQTVYHYFTEKESDTGHSFQIGDGDILAHLTGIITISDFRQKNIASGGQGAPLAPYGEILLIGENQTPVILLNIGGIANFSFFNKGLKMATDTGPGNCISDFMVRRYYPGHYYDKNGVFASEGIVSQRLLEALKSHSFFSKPFPKSTGPEEYNATWLEAILSDFSHLSPRDVISTANQLTADTIASAILSNTTGIVDLYISGGGKHNKTLIDRLKTNLPKAHFQKNDFADIPSDAKEAVIFAVLANESISGPTWQKMNLKHHLSLGKISFPY